MPGTEVMIVENPLLKIDRKLALIWEVLMALANHNLPDPELQTLLSNLLEVKAGYEQTGAEVKNEPEVMN